MNNVIDMGIRVIPILLYKNEGLYKGIKFKNYKYVGDPHNTIRVFSEKEVDELVLLDIDATRNGVKPNIALIQRVAEECYMPFAIGGGINSIETIREVLKAGAEKVIINSAALSNPELIKRASDEFGRTTIVVSIDYKKKLFGKNIVYSHSGTKETRYELFEFAKLMEAYGAGEVIITSIDREGSGQGLDIPVVKQISSMLTIPVVANGGIGSNSDIVRAIKETNVSAIASGSYFIFQGLDRSVLITYKKEWEK